MSGITQAFIGEAWLGTIGSGIRLPILKGATWSAPENFGDYDPNVSNLFEQVFTQGLTYPILSLPLAVTKEWFTATNINTWFNLPRSANNATVYTNAPYYDVAALSTIYLWNGVSGQIWAITGAKVNTLSLGYSLGAYVDARLEVWGILMAPFSGTLPTLTPFTSAPARSQNTSHTLAKNFTRMDLTLSNNLILNDECPSATDRASAPYSSGTYDYASAAERPLEINSTRFTSSMQFTLQSHDVTGLPGSSPSLVDGTPYDINMWAPQATKANKGVTVTSNNPLFYQRYMGGTQAQRNRRQLPTFQRGKTTQAVGGNDPVTVADWTPT